LRNPTRCPVELNLIPKTILKRQQLNQKKPYFIAAVISLILAVFAMGLFFDRVAAVKRQAITDREPKVARLQQKADQMKAAKSLRDAAQTAADQYTDWLETRFSWADLLTELRHALEVTEKATTQPGMQTAVWVERLSPENLQAPSEDQQEESAAPRMPMMDIRMMMRYGLVPKGMKISMDDSAGGGEVAATGEEAPTEPSAEGDPNAAPAAAKPANTNEISTVNLTCRAISWNRLRPTADLDLVNALKEALQASPHFLGGTNGTRLSGEMRPDEGTNSFRFEVKLKLAKPIKL